MHLILLLTSKLFHRKLHIIFHGFFIGDLKVSLTGYDGDIPAFIPEEYFLNVNFEAL
jgi:hypothetical protein